MMKYKYIFLLFFVLIPNFAKGEQRIMILGDSNGAAEGGWVDQLQSLRPTDLFCNLSIAGNTIGFNNGGRDTLNTLKNIESYIESAKQNLGEISVVLILLGTNDCKLVFDSVQHEVPQNLASLLIKIKQNDKTGNLKIVYITPPPIAEDIFLEKKYHGSKKRLEVLIPKIKKITRKQHCSFINLYAPMKKEYHNLNTDGIHLNEHGAMKAAQIINQFLNKNNL